MTQAAAATLPAQASGEASRAEATGAAASLAIKGFLYRRQGYRD